MTEQEYREIHEKNCDPHCRGNCDYRSMILVRDRETHKDIAVRCPLLEEKAKEVIKK
ncbi:MAG: hypothetical protein PHI85_05055 [Victivallaceae bacterium]|nr:hypothetical protein [Victivallaceae bacterium]